MSGNQNESRSTLWFSNWLEREKYGTLSAIWQQLQSDPLGSKNRPQLVPVLLRPVDMKSVASVIKLLYFINVYESFQSRAKDNRINMHLFYWHDGLLINKRFKKQ